MKYKLVDLGLPSGTLWMDRNVGADSPEDAGLYFAWGETQGYTADDVGKTKQFSWSDYKYSNGSYTTMTKYNSTDGLTTLETTDDAAYQYTNGKCRIPTYTQLQELIDNTTYILTTQNGVKGGLFTSKINGNSIFGPVVGNGIDGSMTYVGSSGDWWGDKLYQDNLNNAWYVYFNSSGLHLSYNGSRRSGNSVRGVTVTSK